MAAEHSQNAAYPSELAALQSPKTTLITLERDSSKSHRSLDADISKLLAGKWSGEESRGKDQRMESTTTYRKDGTFEDEVLMQMEKKTITIIVSGKWEVVDRFVRETIEKSSEPKMIPQGTISENEVLGISAEGLAYGREPGKPAVRNRVRD
jgi:hypothetical protein